jgi:predicted GNAT superfamily acetyltransferase
VAAFKVNFYGKGMSAENRGDESDRFMVRWDCRKTEPRVLDVQGAIVLDIDEHGNPVLRESESSIWVAKIPADIVTMRRSDMEQSLRWRLAFRYVITHAQEQDLHVTGINNCNEYFLSSVL